MAEPLAKFWLFDPVSETDTTPTEEIKYKKISVGETLAKFQLLILVEPPSLDFLSIPIAANLIRFVR